MQFVLETRGRSLTTTSKIALNKAIYLINRVVGRDFSSEIVHAKWYWARYPFSLRRKVLWSAALSGWFRPEDESAIECMLHMPTYEPVDWVSPKEGECFLDGGGYVGWYSIRAARGVGNSGRVVVLEPDAINRKQLEQNLALNNLHNVQVLPLALWSQTGSVGWWQGAEPVWHQIKQESEFQQEAVSIDDLVHKLGLARLDWIKLDIEGAEVQAIEGASNTLRNYGPKLFIEVHETRSLILELLKDADYQVVRELYDQLPDHHGWILAQRS